jgi:formylglycine-generating enzyme required for sulfatase activity
MKKLFLLLSVVVISFSFVLKKNKTKDIPEFNYMPAGAFQAFDSVISTPSFFISTTEVTTKQYFVFLDELKAKNEVGIYNIAYPKNIINGVVLLGDRPITNISYEGAMAYCKWLENKLKKNEISKDNLYLFDEKSNFKGSITLPSKVEWAYAAKGGVDSKYYWSNFGNVKQKDICNYRELKPEEILYKDGFVEYKLNDDLHKINKVMSLKPNDYGLFDMSGNVSEMTIEKGIAMGGSFLDGLPDCSTESFQEFSKPSKTIGFRPVVILPGNNLLKSK